MANKLEQPPLTTSEVMSFPQPPLRNSEEYLKAYSGYSYTAISAIAQEVASVDLHLYKAKYVKGQPESTEIYEHESLSALAYVNPLITLYDLIEATQIYLELLGEAFWVILKEGDKPAEIWPIRPDWVKIIPSKTDVIEKYTYHPGGGINKIDIPKENMIQFKYFNPLNPYRGKGSIQAAALPLDIHTFAQEYNRNFFFNSAIPSLVFTTDKPLSETVVKKFVNQWQMSYGGRNKSNKIAFLGNGLKIDKVTTGAKELDFTEQMKMMRDDVLAVFKVPKTILGLTDDVNRANAEATTVAFMERVVTPRMKRIVETINEFFLPMYGDDTLFFDFTDPAPENTEMKLKYYENASKYGWMTPNEIRAEENMEPIEGGDELPKQTGNQLPNEEEPIESPTGEEEPTEEKPKKPTAEEGAGLIAWLSKMLKKKEVVRLPIVRRVKKVKHMVRIPVKKLATLKRENLEKALTPKIIEIIGDLLSNKHKQQVGFTAKGKKEEPKEDKPLWDDARKDAYWRKFVDSSKKREASLRNVAINKFRKIEKIVLANLNKDVKHWKVESRKGMESSVLPSIEEMNKLWRLAWKLTVTEMFIEQGNYILDFLGATGAIDITSATARAYLQTYSATLIKEINTTTRQKLRDTLAEGFDLKEGIEKLTKRVKEVFRDATTARAEMIARTEALRASNSATVEAYRQSNVVQSKEWLTERDNRVCPFCNEMDGKTVGLNEAYFKKGDDMTVNGETMKFDFTGVPEPPLHVDCRCTTIPVLKE